MSLIDLVVLSFIYHEDNRSSEERISTFHRTDTRAYNVDLSYYLKSNILYHLSTII